MVPTRTELQQVVAAVPELQVHPEWVGGHGSVHGLVQTQKLTVRGMLDEVGVFLEAVIDHVTFSLTQLDDAVWMEASAKSLSPVVRDVDIADAVIGSVLVWAKSSDNGSDDPEMVQLAARAHDLAANLFEARKRTHPIKKRLEVLANYNDINNVVIGSLRTEIDNYLEQLSGILMTTVRLIGHDDDVNDLKWETLLERIRRESVTTALHLNLPTFNTEDQKMYLAYCHLEECMSPLKIALDVIPMRVEQFAVMSGQLYPDALAELSANHSVLTKKWIILQHEMKLFRRSYVDSKWSQIFGFLTDSLLSKCTQLSEDLKALAEVSDELASAYKLCSQGINILAMIVSDKLISDTQLIRKYNNKLLVEWEKLNEIMSYIKPPELAERPVTNDHNGFTLGLGIESPAIPFSIEKKDRIRDIFLEDIDGSFEVDPEVEAQIRPLKAGLLEEFKATRDNFFDLIKQLSAPKFPTRLPVICEDFFEQGHPRVKKQRLDQDPISKIPTISPTHAVFLSPLRSPAPQLAVPESDKHKLLQVTTTPKLAHPDNSGYSTPSPAIISTSPERPESAMGHRFSDKHLVQPFRRKHSWK